MWGTSRRWLPCVDDPVRIADRTGIFILDADLGMRLPAYRRGKILSLRSCGIKKIKVILEKVKEAGWTGRSSRN
jgi:hypothetical protein